MQDQVTRAARVVAALAKLAARRMPKWGALVIGACLLIPGPLDELAVMPALGLYVIARNWREAVSVARSTWAR